MIEFTEAMEDVTLSPKASTKLKSRECARKMKHGSPKLQQVLRERCRRRMQQKRGQLFNRSRFGLEIEADDMRVTLTGIVREELLNIAITDQDPAVNPFSRIVNEPLNLEDAIELENEILMEEEQWIFEEYEKICEEELEFLALTADQLVDEVICPMCQISNFSEVARQVTCTSCGFKLNNTSLKEIGHSINKSVNSHSATCSMAPGFMQLTQNSLHLFCNKCSASIPIFKIE